MKRLVTTLMLFALVAPALAKTQKDVYNVPCSVLWSAIKDTLRNSGKYGIIAIDNTELTASYTIGGSLAGKRINSVVLNSQGDNCEMQAQTAFSGWANNDAGDFKKRVDESLAKMKTQPAPSAKPADSNSQPATGEGAANPAAPPAKPANTTPGK